MNKYWAEVIGTFALVFAGTGALVVNDASQGQVTPVGVALTFGPVVLAMRWWRLGEVWIYLAAPVPGAVAAVGGCRCLHREDCCPGAREGASI